MCSSTGFAVDDSSDVWLRDEVVLILIDGDVFSLLRFRRRSELKALQIVFRTSDAMNHFQRVLIDETSFLLQTDVSLFAARLNLDVHRRVYWFIDEYEYLIT